MPSRRVGVENFNCGLGCLGAPAVVDFDESAGDASSARNISYHKLPPHRLKLSILKLDGSAFDVLIEKNATVGQVKQAVEDVFTSSSNNVSDQISWSHVWGHFCLTFDGRKLLNDRSYVREFGIMDGVQLEFVQHLSVNYSPRRRQPKRQSQTNRQAAVSAHLETEDSSSNEEDKNRRDYNNLDHDVQPTEFRLPQFLRGFLSYSGLQGENRKESGTQGRPSRFSKCLPFDHYGYTAMEVCNEP